MDAIATVSVTVTGAPQTGAARSGPTTTPTASYRSAAEVPPPEASNIWALPHRPRSARTARRLVQGALRCWCVDEDTAERALLVTSELVTNAVEHALPPVTLYLRRCDDRTLHIEVGDGGPAGHEGDWTTSCAPEEHGRGHTIVALVATGHGSCTRPGGATYWADL